MSDGQIEYSREALDATAGILERAKAYDDTSFSLAERVQMSIDEADVEEAYSEGYQDALDDFGHINDEEDDDAE